MEMYCGACLKGKYFFMCENKDVKLFSSKAIFSSTFVGLEKNEGGQVCIILVCTHFMSQWWTRLLIPENQGQRRIPENQGQRRTKKQQLICNFQCAKLRHWWRQRRCCFVSLFRSNRNVSSTSEWQWTASAVRIPDSRRIFFLRGQMRIFPSKLQVIKHLHQRWCQKPYPSVNWKSCRLYIIKRGNLQYLFLILIIVSGTSPLCHLSPQNCVEGKIIFCVPSIS